MAKKVNKTVDESVIELPTVTPMIELLSSLSLGASLVDADGKYTISGAGVKKKKVPGALYDIAVAHDYLETKMSMSGDPIPNTYTLTEVAMNDLVGSTVKNELPTVAGEIPVAEDAPDLPEVEAEEMPQGEDLSDAPTDDLPEQAETDEPTGGDLIGAEITAAMNTGTVPARKRSSKRKRK